MIKILFGVLLVIVIIWFGLLVTPTVLDTILEIMTLLEEIKEKTNKNKEEKQNGTDV